MNRSLVKGVKPLETSSSRLEHLTSNIEIYLPVMTHKGLSALHQAEAFHHTSPVVCHIA
jgi:hypothetical protein